MHKSCCKEADYKTTLESTKAQDPVYYSFNLEIKNWQKSTFCCQSHCGSGQACQQKLAKEVCKIHFFHSFIQELDTAMTIRD